MFKLVNREVFAYHNFNAGRFQCASWQGGTRPLAKSPDLIHTTFVETNSSHA
jgi:hypothetical protein